MTDYAEDQQNEIDALQSIYPDEIESRFRQSPEICIVSVSIVFTYRYLDLMGLDYYFYK